MYQIKLQNGSIVGEMSLVRAVLKMRSSAVVVGVVRMSDKKEVR